MNEREHDNLRARGPARKFDGPGRSRRDARRNAADAIRPWEGSKSDERRGRPRPVRTTPTWGRNRVIRHHPARNHTPEERVSGVDRGADVRRNAASATGRSGDASARRIFPGPGIGRRACRTRDGRRLLRDVAEGWRPPGVAVSGPRGDSFRDWSQHPEECRRQLRNAACNPASFEAHVRNRSRRSSRSARVVPDRSAGSGGNAYRSGVARRGAPSVGYVARTDATLPPSTTTISHQVRFYPGFGTLLS